MGEAKRRRELDPRHGAIPKEMLDRIRAMEAGMKGLQQQQGRGIWLSSEEVDLAYIPDAQISQNPKLYELIEDAGMLGQLKGMLHSYDPAQYGIHLRVEAIEDDELKLNLDLFPLFLADPIHGMDQRSQPIFFNLLKIGGGQVIVQDG